MLQFPFLARRLRPPPRQIFLPIPNPASGLLFPLRLSAQKANTSSPPPFSTRGATNAFFQRPFYSSLEARIDRRQATRSRGVARLIQYAMLTLPSYWPMQRAHTVGQPSSPSQPHRSSTRFLALLVACSISTSAFLVPIAS
jgi:hypothetical protein